MSHRDVLLSNIPDLLIAFADDGTPSQAYAKLATMNSPLATMPFNSFKTTAPVVVATVKHIAQTTAEHEQAIAYVPEAYNHTLGVLEATLTGYQEALTVIQQCSLYEHTLPNANGVQASIQNSVCADPVAIDEGLQALDNSSVCQHTLPNANGVQDSVQVSICQHTLPNGNGIQDSVQNSVCADPVAIDEGLQALDNSSVCQHTLPNANGVQDSVQVSICPDSIATTEGLQTLNSSGVQGSVCKHMLPNGNGIQDSVCQHTLPNGNGIQDSVQVSICPDSIATTEGLQTLNSSGVQGSVCKHMLPNGNGIQDSVCQHTLPNGNGIQDSVQVSICPDSIATTEGLQTLNSSGVQGSVCKHMLAMTEEQIVNIVQREIKKMLDAAGIGVPANKHTPTVPNQMRDTIDATGTPTVYNGWSVNRGNDGYLRINRKLKGINKTIHIGKNWNAEKAQTKIDQFLATLGQRPFAGEGNVASKPIDTLI